MAEPVGPTFIPKAVLTTGRVVHQPFEIPTEMTKSALLQGGVAHSAVGDLNKVVSKAVMDLKPRGPLAKLFEGVSRRVDDSLVSSAAKAQRATEVFWVPFSNGTHQVGHAVSNPFALFYAKRAGFEIPDDAAAAQQLLASITDPNPDSTKFPGFTWPMPAPPAEEPKAPDGGDGGGTPPPTDGDGTTPPPTDGDGTTPPPTDGDGTTPPPTDGDGTTPPPTDGEGTPPPTEGEGTPPPAEGGGEGTPPPTEGEGTPPPAEGEAGTTEVPADGGGEVVATDQGPATNTGVASEEVGSPVPEGARPLAPVVDPAAPDAASAAAAAGADAIVAPATADPGPVMTDVGPAAPPVHVHDEAPPQAPVAPVAPPA